METTSYAAPPPAQWQQPAPADDFARFTLAYPTGQPETSTVLVEKIVPKQVRVGQRYSYTIRVTNLTDAALHNVVINETASGLTIERTPPLAGEPAQPPGHWVIGTLPPRATQTINASAVSTQVGLRSTCLGVDVKPTMCTAVNVVNPDLRITKTAPRTAYMCERPSFTYAVTNTGTGIARDVVISEMLPNGLTTLDGRQEIVINAGDLPPGATRTFRVTLAPKSVGTFQSRAVAHSEDVGAVNSAPSAIQIVQPELGVEITGPEWQYSGEPVSYTIAVTNHSDVPARDTRLNLDSPLPIAAGNQRSLGTLQPGQTKSTNVTLQSAVDPIELRASAHSACSPPVSNRIVTDIRGAAALRVETVDTRDPIRVGDTTTYEVSVKNQGNAMANNVQVNSVLPDGMTLLDINGPTKGRPEGDKIALGPIDIQPGATAKWVIAVRSEQPGTMRFRTEVDSEFLDRPVPDVEPTRVLP